MSTQYNSIGDSYIQVKDLPLMRYLEIPAVRAAIQPYLSDRAGEAPRILDLACGTGFYSRLLLSWGASSVLGIDISPAMIDAARAHPDSVAAQGRLTFRVGDAANLGVLSESTAPFNIVTAVLLLPHAASGAEMTAIWETVAQNLGPGGVFVGVAVEPVDDHDLAQYVARQRVQRAHNPSPFGMELEYDETTLASGEGYHVKVTPRVERAFSFDAYHLTRGVYEAAARKAGMTGDVEWRVMDVTDEARAAMGDKYWDSYKEYIPKYAVIVVHK